MKRILVISSSEREDSNSHGLAEAFAQGARRAGHHVDFVSLRGKTIRPCLACYQCAQGNGCAQSDDAPALVDLIARAQVIAFATPTYFYAMCGQLKTLLDRTTPLYGKPQPFGDIYLLVSAGEDDAAVGDRVAAGLQGWIDCYAPARLAGIVFAGGLNDEGAYRSRPDALEAAHNMGLNA